MRAYLIILRNFAMSLELKPLIGKLNTTCRRAFELAAELCVSQNHYSVEIEHLLIKLLEQPDTDIRRILRYYDVELSRLNRELNQSLDKFKRGNSRTPTMSPYILSLLKEAWLISSLNFNADNVRSGAILQGLIDHDTLRGILLEAVPCLSKISREFLRNDIRDLIKQSAEEISAQFKQDIKSSETTTKVNSNTPSLEQFTVDLTEEARLGKIDAIEGRDNEIRQIIDILTRRRQNNPILTGDAGVGKTAVVEGFALRIAKGDVPPALRNISVRALDLGLLQAGAGVKGEFENRLKSIINEIKGSPRPIILFIDEAHTLIGAGGAAGQGDAANLLKPALARGELRTIAATTWGEYKKYFEKDPALTRRFQVVKVPEPDEETAVIMLRSVVAKLEAHHNVLILEESVREAVRLSHRYIAERQLPDKAVSVLDTACARVNLAQNSEPPVIEAARRRLELMTEELRLLNREQATGRNHQQRISEITAEIENVQKLQTNLESRWKEELALVKKIHGLEEKAAKNPNSKTLHELEELKNNLSNLHQHDQMIPLCVDAQIVAKIISAWTGIPVGKMLTDEINIILNIKEKMAERVIGQNTALDTLSRRVQTYHASLDDPQKPVGVFLLAGPSGVGKTETAITLAELLYGGERNLITINMSEYQESYTVSSLKGAPPGYVGYGKGGVLTEAVRRNPYSVVLLDEIEKAHPDVLEVFYQVFDKGTLEDGDGVVVDFKNTLILLTTNLGTDTIMFHTRQQSVQADILQEALKQELLKHFKPAFLGRMVLIPYHPLGDHQIRDIVRLKLDKLGKRFLENHRARFSYDESIIDAITWRCTEVDSGARNIDHILTQSVLPTLSMEILQRMANTQHFLQVHLSCDSLGEIFYQFDSDVAINGETLTPTSPSTTNPNQLLGDLDSLLNWLKSS
jgi:type VI secretion system protein VasG